MHIASTRASGWSERIRVKTASKDPSLPRLPDPNSPKNPICGRARSGGGPRAKSGAQTHPNPWYLLQEPEAAGTAVGCRRSMSSTMPADSSSWIRRSRTKLDETKSSWLKP